MKKWMIQLNKEVRDVINAWILKEFEEPYWNKNTSIEYKYFLWPAYKKGAKEELQRGDHLVIDPSRYTDYTLINLEELHAYIASRLGAQSSDRTIPEQNIFN